MYLINVDTIELEAFNTGKIPRYCILSHRWGDDEVTFKEFRKGKKKTGEGYRKIVEFCKLIKSLNMHWDRDKEKMTERRIRYVWVDTCCIDKRSSAELSEAINSMYQYYSDATECIVHMKDVFVHQRQKSMQQFESSTWFKRGWTLQEMLAPTLLIFCDANWRVFGHQLRHGNVLFAEDYEASISKHHGPSLQSKLSAITKIHGDFFSGRSKLREASIAQRMGWASRRVTTRVEDEAYCLLGIFDINMPLIYGEGRKAFTRLQEEIIRRSTDQSILAWETSSSFPPAIPVLAGSPKDFPIVKHLEEKAFLDQAAYTITNKGLEMRGDVMEVRLRELRAFAEHRQGDVDDPTLEHCYLVLNYERHGKRPQILLKGMRHNLYYRVNQEKDDIIGGSLAGAEKGELMKGQLIYLGTGNEIVVSKR